MGVRKHLVSEPPLKAATRVAVGVGRALANTGIDATIKWPGKPVQ